MTYYTLVARLSLSDDNSETSPWAPEFGDYERETVEYEKHDMRGNGYRADNLKIIRTKTARQSEINAAIAKLNTPATCRGCDNPPLPGYDVCAACGEEGY